LNNDYVQYGSHRHLLTGEEPASQVLRWAAGVSSHVSMVLSTVRTLANPGVKVRRKLLMNMGEVGLVGPGTAKDKDIELWSVTHWIGTSGPLCMLRLPTGPAVVDRIITVAQSVFWSYGPWQDLALYRDRRVVYYCLTHECQAALYGSAQELRALGLKPTPSADHWSARGERFDREYTRALVSELVSGGPGARS
jgi:hypothetical protein